MDVGLAGLVVDAATDGIFIVDPVSSTVVDANGTAGHLVGLGIADVLRTRSRSTSATQPDGIGAVIDQALNGRPSATVDVWYRRGPADFMPAEASLTVISDGPRRLISVVVRDPAPQRHAEQALRTLQRQALYDPLTGFPGRALFVERLDEWARRVGHLGDSRDDLAVLTLGIDGFAQVNVSLGRGAGDEVLKVVASRLDALLRDADRNSRVTGDEFAIATAVHHVQGAIDLAQRTLHALRQPIEVGTESITLGATCGITLLAGRQIGADALLQEAETALRHGKTNRRGGWTLYQPEHQRRAKAAVRATGELLAALARKELQPHFQPVVLPDGTLTAVEALARWEHPRRGLLSPNEFVPLAERSGLIGALGEQILARSATAVAELSRSVPELAPLRLAVNAAPAQLTDRGFASTVADACEAAGLPPDRLILEITETSLLGEPLQVQRTLSAVHEMGCQVALDDFGRGYSSLSHLRDFEIDIVKIDRSFVSGLPDDAQSFAIVRAVIDMTRALNLVVVAEGVEDTAQREMLTEMGCDRLQGYLFGRPAPLDELVTHSLRPRTSGQRVG